MTDADTNNQKVVQDQLTEVAKVAAEQLGSLGFIIVALHPDGYAQYTCSVDPLQAAAVMYELGGSVVKQNAHPDWYEFQNHLRIMNSIDRHELVEAGVMDTDAGLSWEAFSNDPYRSAMKMDDEKAEKLWSIIQKRSAGN